MAADTGLPFASLPGLGNEEIPGFPVDRCPEELPDLSKLASTYTYSTPV